MQIFHGNILFSKTYTELACYEDSYLLIEQGKVKEIFSTLPEQYKEVKITDYGKAVIIPAFSDLHVHASQYIERGLGMDMLLADWLNQYTFPQEARFKEMDYAHRVYDAFLKDMIRHGTFHAAIFTTIHREASSYLIQEMEKLGLYAYVGKVNMDMASPDYLCEETDISLKETERFLDDFKDHRRAKPIITPRFAPTCSEKLIQGLGELAQKYHVGLQTHLVESLWEAEEALRVFPAYSCDTEIYEKAGLMDYGPVIGAHFIFPSEKDKEILKRHKGYTVHCPDATNNIIAGIMGVSALHKDKVQITLGSDVGGGHSLGVFTQIARAVQLSKMKWFYEPENADPITFANAFYLATKAGGEVFGTVGSFEKDYHFNALVIEDMSDSFTSLSPAETVERFCYIGNPDNIIARYLEGNLLQ